MTMIRLALPLAFASVLGAALALGPQNPPAVPLTPVHLSGAVHLLQGGYGGNIAAHVGDDGVLLVDAQFEPQVEMIRAALAELGQVDVDFLLNTHWHRDHTGGNALLGSEATILAHTNVRKRLVEPQVLTRGTTDARVPAALPVVTFDSGLAVHFNGEELRVLHYPNAHTDGDGAVWFTGSNVLHTGDIFFNGLFPFVDVETGGSVLGVERAVASMLEWLPDDAQVIPGHGDLGGVEDLRTYQHMLLDSMQLVRAALEEGQTADDMVAGELLARYESWSWQFISTEAFLRTLAAELGG